MLVGVVLVVMIGGTALTLPGPRLAAGAPDAVHGAGVDGRLVRDVLDLGDARPRRLLAALFVIGSYYAAEYVKVKRPQRRGLAPAQRAVEVPAGAPVGSPQPGV